MEATTTRTLHPALWVASIAATAFSLVGIASMTGVLPQKADVPVQTAALTQPATVAASAVPAVPTAPVATTPTTTVNVQVAAPAPAPAAKAAATPRPVRRAAPRSEPVASRDEPRDEGFRNLSTTPAQPAAPALCRDCGIVEAVNAIEQPGEASGLGAAAGGVLGGVVGNQIGNGGTRQTARILGMIGGAVAGHQIEKSQRKTMKYELVVRFEDGTTRRFDYDSQPAWHTGERVKLVNGVLVANA